MRHCRDSHGCTPRKPAAKSSTPECSKSAGPQSVKCQHPAAMVSNMSLPPAAIPTATQPAPALGNPVRQTQPQGQAPPLALPRRPTPQLARTSIQSPANWKWPRPVSAEKNDRVTTLMTTNLNTTIACQASLIRASALSHLVSQTAPKAIASSTAITIFERYGQSCSSNATEPDATATTAACRPASVTIKPRRAKAPANSSPKPEECDPTNTYPGRRAFQQPNSPFQARKGTPAGGVTVGTGQIISRRQHQMCRCHIRRQIPAAKSPPSPNWVDTACAAAISALKIQEAQVHAVAVSQITHSGAPAKSAAPPGSGALAANTNKLIASTADIPAEARFHHGRRSPTKHTRPGLQPAYRTHLGRFGTSPKPSIQKNRLAITELVIPTFSDD